MQETTNPKQEILQEIRKKQHFPARTHKMSCKKIQKNKKDLQETLDSCRLLAGFLRILARFLQKLLQHNSFRTLSGTQVLLNSLQHQKMPKDTMKNNSFRTLSGHPTLSDSFPWLPPEPPQVGHNFPARKFKKTRNFCKKFLILAGFLRILAKYLCFLAQYSCFFARFLAGILWRKQLH